jgi:hypothetical protein
MQTFGVEKKDHLKKKHCIQKDKPTNEINNLLRRMMRLKEKIYETRRSFFSTP